MSTRKTIHELLAEARQGLQRLTAEQAHAAVAEGAVLIDTRSDVDRHEQGAIPAARHYPLSVLEWRLCPTASHSDGDIEFDEHVILLCAHGYSSSLAAARLQSLGFARATDVVDGVEGWREAGLPITPLEPARAAIRRS